MIDLRAYQSEAIDATLAYWRDGGGNPLVDMATGLGKSVVIAELTRRLIQQWPALNVLMLVHVKELVEQNFKQLVRLWPQALPIAGINSAGLGRRDRRKQILFASIQSVYRADAWSLNQPDLVVIDEAHLVPAKGAGMYRQLLHKLRQVKPDLRVVGFTATPYRMDSGRLDAGDGALFDETIYSYGIGAGIRDGWLSPLVSKASMVEIDVSGVAKRGGEFVAGALEAAADVDGITRAAAGEIARLGAERRSWLAFCTGVDHAYHVRDAVRATGHSAETVTGETPAADRARYIADFKAGRIRCLTNANVLTTGFDAPGVDLIAFLRPTLSTGLYVQMAGRGTRLADGKDNCIAEGQRVLTDHGLVPIEMVTTGMKVWDGVEFVNHCGTVFRGEKEVIRYAGLEATTDHLVWTKTGWKALGQCAVEQTAVAVTGDGRAPIRKAEGRFRRNRSEERWGKASYSRRMHQLWRTIFKRLHELDERLCRLSFVFHPTACTEVASHAGYLSQTTLHEPEGLGIRALWGARHLLRIRIADCDGGVGTRELGFTPRDGAGQNRQRRELCSWQSTLSNPSAEPIEQAWSAADIEAARVQVCASRRTLFGRNAPKVAGVGHDASGDRGALSEAIGQAKRRVWDVLNAGPRHSFTVEGLLVHNCLVLDFAGNVRRHGPVDTIEIRPKRAKGEADATEKVTVDDVKAKTCPACEALVALRATTCPHCGHEWPAPPAPIEREADATVAILSTERLRPVDLPVITWRASRWSKQGGTDSVRVEYFAGVQAVSEWVCPEHEGFAGEKAGRWWRQHGGADPAPATVAEFIARWRELTMPEAIRTRQNGKWLEVVGRRLTFDRRAAE